MKLFNSVVILLIIFLAFCTAQEKKTTMNPSGIAEGDTVVLAELEYYTKFLPDSPFRIDSIKVKNNQKLGFKNTTEFSATFIIPNSDKLFVKNMGYDSFLVDSVQYLFIPIRAKKQSRLFSIRLNANPDSISVVYPFSAFCKNGTIAAERNSSPIIIVDP